MDTNLRRAAVAVALISGLAGRLLAVAPTQQSTFEVTTLARVNRAEAPAPVITPLIPTGSSGIAEVIGANAKLGEPLEAGCE